MVSHKLSSLSHSHSHSRSRSATVSVFQIDSFIAVILSYINQTLTLIFATMKIENQFLDSQETVTQLSQVSSDCDDYIPFQASMDCEDCIPLVEEESDCDDYIPLVEDEGEEEEEEGETVRRPLPVIRDALNDDDYCTYSDHDDDDDEGIWESAENFNLNPNSDLVTLYRPPMDLMFRGTFEEAKVAAAAQDKWLIVNLQSMKEFDSHVMNRDLWSNETVVEMIKSYFLFWQRHHHTVEGMKVSTFYRLDSFPVILVIDPIMGGKMGLWKGMIQPECLLMDLLIPFIENGGPLHQLSIPFCCKRQKREEEKEDDDEEMMMCPPPPPEEACGESSFVCSVGFRVRDGRRFKLVVAIPGASNRLDYEIESSFEESGISKSMISLTWE